MQAIETKRHYNNCGDQHKSHGEQIVKNTKNHKGEIIWSILAILLVVSFISSFVGEISLSHERTKFQAMNAGYHKAACEYDNILSDALSNIIEFKQRRDCKPYQETP